MKSPLALLRREVRQSSGDWSVPWPNSAQATTYVSEYMAYNLSSVWACQTLIADSIATLPVATYRKQGDTRVETTPPAWLERPNQ